MLFAALSDANVAALISLAGVVVSGFMTAYLASINSRSKEALVAASETAAKLDKSTEATESKLEKTAVAVEATATAVDGVSAAISEIAAATDGKLDAFKADTDDKLTAISKTSDETHKLVNSNMGTALELNAILSKQIAEMTTDPELKKLAVEAATRAKERYEEHMRKQGVVDEGK